MVNLRGFVVLLTLINDDDDDDDDSRICRLQLFIFAQLMVLARHLSFLFVRLSPHFYYYYYDYITTTVTGGLDCCFDTNYIDDNNGILALHNSVLVFIICAV